MASTTTGVDIRAMLLIHRVLRREIGALPRLFRGAAGNPARAGQVSAHTAEMLEFLHVHHSGEDELLWPVLRTRVALEAELIDQMEADHRQVAAAVERLNRDLPDWGRTADAATGEQLASTAESLYAALESHLAEEELRILPLVSEHLTEQEWDALGEHGFAAIPPKRRLVVLGHILEEADPAERAHFVTKVPAPARIAFTLFGRRQFTREVAAIRGVPQQRRSPDA
jgi:DUF438 domain-containing protein